MASHELSRIDHAFVIVPARDYCLTGGWGYGKIMRVLYAVGSDLRHYIKNYPWEVVLRTDVRRDVLLLLFMYDFS